MTNGPGWARFTARAVARPTIPAPTTSTSVRSMAAHAIARRAGESTQVRRPTRESLGGARSRPCPRATSARQPGRRRTAASRQVPGPSTDCRLGRPVAPDPPVTSVLSVIARLGPRGSSCIAQKWPHSALGAVTRGDSDRLAPATSRHAPRDHRCHPLPARRAAPPRPLRVTTRPVVVFSFENRTWQDVGAGFGDAMPFLHQLGTPVQLVPASGPRPTRETRASASTSGRSPAPLKRKPTTANRPRRATPTGPDNLFRQVRTSGRDAINYVSSAADTVSDDGNKARGRDHTRAASRGRQEGRRRTFREL